LTHASLTEEFLIFGEVLAEARALMTHKFGNVVIQKFLEFGRIEQQHALIVEMQGSVVQLALDMYGSLVLEKALGSIPADMRVSQFIYLFKHQRQMA